MKITRDQLEIKYDSAKTEDGWKHKAFVTHKESGINGFGESSFSQQHALANAIREVQRGVAKQKA